MEQVIRNGKCPKCKQPAQQILYHGSKKLTHKSAADTKACSK